MTGNDGNGTAPAGSTGATVIFWNKRTGGSTGTWDRICEFRFGAPAQSRTRWIGYYNNVTDRIHCSQTLFTAAGGTTPQYSSIDPTWADAGLTLTIGQYYFHAWTYVNSTRERKYYINANLAATNTRPGFGDLMNPGSGDMFIGGTSDENSLFIANNIVVDTASGANSTQITTDSLPCILSTTKVKTIRGYIKTKYYLLHKIFSKS